MASTGVLEFGLEGRALHMASANADELGLKGVRYCIMARTRVRPCASAPCVHEYAHAERRSK
eukprot:657688-Pelagomonas_calceolata.AAC.10